MSLSNLSYSLIFASALMVFGCASGSAQQYKTKGYIITGEEDALSEQSSEYLYSHLSKRTTQKEIVLSGNSSLEQAILDGFRRIHFEVTASLPSEYCIKPIDYGFKIQVRDKRTAIWITYQLIENIAEEDNRFTAVDLPPSIIDFSEKCKEFDFIYREPYFAPNLGEDYAPVMGTNNLETDWGLWGHNLSKTIGENPPIEMFALVEGKRNKEQFCFSSPALFKFISDYILDNFGNGQKQSYRFMIMPQDNTLSCTCALCVKHGNTEHNATPVVTEMIRKLAKTFPLHQFFTSSYLTTSLPPSNKLPQNTGVIFSTIDLPKGVELEKQSAVTKRFIKEIELWKQKTDQIYLWDYVTNFDDYLTPIPALYGLQKQLEFFKKLGVKGIFLNASGYDYLPFDDVKTFVAGALLMDTESNVDELCKRFFKKKYPKSHSLLSDYYLSLEQHYRNKNTAYNMYGGIQHSLETYLDADAFIAFYNSLSAIIPKTIEPERGQLVKMRTALSFTRLQIAYVKGTGKWGYAVRQGNKVVLTPEIKTILRNLKAYVSYPDLINYKESGGALSAYVAEWERLIKDAPVENRIIDVPIQVLSKCDEGFESADLLHDGKLGFGIDYHQGWFLSSTDDLYVNIPVGSISNTIRIKLRFLLMDRHGMRSPEKILLIKDGKLVKTLDAKQIHEKGKIAECEVFINVSDGTNLQLKMIRKQAKKSIIACDEILIMN